MEYGTDILHDEHCVFIVLFSPAKSPSRARCLLSRPWRETGIWGKKKRRPAEGSGPYFPRDDGTAEGSELPYETPAQRHTPGLKGRGQRREKTNIARFSSTAARGPFISCGPEINSVFAPAQNRRPAYGGEINGETKARRGRRTLRGREI